MMMMMMMMAAAVVQICPRQPRFRLVAPKFAVFQRLKMEL
jgi:hypothetical protein